MFLLAIERVNEPNLSGTLMEKSKTETTHGQRLAVRWKALGSWLFAIVGTVVVVLLLMVFAGVFTRKVATSQAAVGRQLSDGTQVVEARLMRQPRFESAVGSIEPVHKSSVSAKILAKVSEVNVLAGQAVKAGEVLVRLVDSDLQSRLKQVEAAYSAAQASAEQARSDLARANQLIQGNAISRAEFEETATNARTSAAEVERLSRAIEEARVIVDYATITAPFDGVVVDKKLQAGDTVVPGQTLLTLYDPEQMQLVANVRESFAMQLKVGQQVAAKLESMDHECLATVREVVPQAEEGSRSFQVKVSGPCPPGIYSGMFGRIMLPLEDEEMVVVPAAAVKRIGQLTLADVVEGETVVRRSLQLGRYIGDDVEVLSGLLPGERVAVSNREGTH